MSRIASSGGTGAITCIAMESARGSDRTSRSQGLACISRTSPCCIATRFQTYHTASREEHTLGEHVNLVAVVSHAHDDVFHRLFLHVGMGLRCPVHHHLGERTEAMLHSLTFASFVIWSSIRTAHTADMVRVGLADSSVCTLTLSGTFCMVASSFSVSNARSFSDLKITASVPMLDVSLSSTSTAKGQMCNRRLPSSPGLTISDVFSSISTVFQVAVICSDEQFRMHVFCRRCQQVLLPTSTSSDAVRTPISVACAADSRASHSTSRTVFGFHSARMVSSSTFNGLGSAAAAATAPPLPLLELGL